MSDDLAYLGIVEAGKLFAARKLSPVELTDALLARLDSNGGRRR